MNRARNPSKIMPCPECGHGFGFTLDTRPVREAIRRRRECAECAHRFTTYETREHPDAARQTREHKVGAALLAALNSI